MLMYNEQLLFKVFFSMWKNFYMTFLLNVVQVTFVSLTLSIRGFSHCRQCIEILDLCFIPIYLLPGFLLTIESTMCCFNEFNLFFFVIASLFNHMSR